MKEKLNVSKFMDETGIVVHKGGALMVSGLPESPALCIESRSSLL